MADCCSNESRRVRAQIGLDGEWKIVVTHPKYGSAHFGRLKLIPGFDEKEGARIEEVLSWFISDEDQRNKYLKMDALRFYYLTTSRFVENRSWMSI